MVGFWLILALIGVSLAPHLESRLATTETPPPGSESAQAAAIMREAFPQFEGTAHLAVLHHPFLAVADPVFRDANEALIARWRQIPGVRSVTPWSEQDTTMALLIVTSPEVSGSSAVEALRDPRPPEPFELSVTGSAAASVDLFRLLSERLGQIERFSILISLGVLIYAFGGVLLAFLALGMGLICLAIIPLLLYGLSGIGAVSVLNGAIAAVVALALGLDYPLLFLSRLREELQTRSVSEALDRAFSTAGRTLLVSTLILVGAGLSLLLVPLEESRSVALTLAGSAVLTLALAWTLLPALITLLARRWDLPQHLGRAQRGGGAAWWAGIVRLSVRYPRRALVLGFLALGLLIAPATQLKTWVPYVSMLPESLESRRGLDRVLELGEGGAASPILVVWSREEGVGDPAFLRQIRSAGEALESDPRIGRAESIASHPLPPEALASLLRSPAMRWSSERLGVSPDGKHALMRITSRLAPDDPRIATLIEDLRATLAVRVPAGATTRLGGMPAELTDVQRAFTAGMPWVLGANLLVVLAVLGVYLRSLVLPLKAVLTNLLPVFAGLGVVVAVFQWGGGEPVQSLTVTLILSLLFAISMDYEVFMLARIREAFDRTGGHAEAIVEGLTGSGRVILGGALVLLSVFVPYTLVGVRGLQELGVGLSVALVVDATIVRLIVVPAAMQVMGSWNYWLPGGKRAGSAVGSETMEP